MNRPIYTTLAIIIAATVFSCNSNKPKPASDSISKTSVTVAGKKDSVINNPQKNYGNATIAEPCVKCIIQVLQANSSYKTTVQQNSNVKYVINYIKSTQPADTAIAVNATNALRVDVMQQPGTSKLATFVYDNSVGKMYSVTGKSKAELAVDANSLKKIRNSCYWGVASGK